MKKLTCTFVALVSVAYVANAGNTYYVATNGNDSYTSAQAQSPSTPWKTVGKASSVMVAGETAVINAGTYNETVNTARSGSSGSRIKFQASGAVTTGTWNVHHDYITIDGFSVTNGGTIYTSTDGGSDGNYCEILNNHIMNGSIGMVYKSDPTGCLIKGNHLVVTSGPGSDFTQINVWGTSNIVANNEIGPAQDIDAFRFWGHENIIRSNYIHDVTLSAGSTAHMDIFQTFGDNGDACYNYIIEDNFAVNSQGQMFNLEETGANIHDVIFRNNVWAHFGENGNIKMPNVSFFNNTFYDTGFFYHSSMNATGTVFKNNIFIGLKGWYNNTAYGPIGAGGNLFRSELGVVFALQYNFFSQLNGTALTGFDNQTGGINGGAINFANAATNDYSLSSNSPAIDHGTTLTGFNYDLVGTTRPQGSGWDMGAYEYAPAPVSRWVTGYYAGWEHSSYPISEIDWSNLTHLAVAFYLINTDGTMDESLSDGSGGPTLAHSLVNAAHANGCKALASLGGADSQAGFEGAASDAHRAAFVQNLKTIVTTYGYDGLDLDWEPFDAVDHASMTSLIADLHAAMPGIILTMPVGGSLNQNMPDDVSYFATIASQLDQINLMSYGMSGAWQGWSSWHASPLYWNHNSSTPVGIDVSVDAYLAVGVPAAKLGVGSGFYGLGYTSPVTAPVQPLNGSIIAASDGVMSYAHIMSAYYSTNACHWDNGAKVPYLSFASPHGPENCTYVSYEDEQSIGEKTAFIKSRGLNGMIIWTMGEGYIPANPAGQRNPLMKAIGSGLLAATPPDTNAPTVSLTAPANGATVSNVVIVSATAADNVAVAGVQFKLDGSNLGAEDTISPYSISWDTTGASKGSHTLTGVARDAAGNAATSTPVTVTVSNSTPSGPAGLIGWWKLDESSGTTAADSSGNGNNGTLNGVPVWHPTGGKLVGALNFNSGDYVDCGAATSLNTPSVTVAFWMKPSQMAVMCPVDKLPMSAGVGYAVRLRDTGAIWFRLGSEPGTQYDVYGDAIYTNGVWTHVAATFDSASGAARLYINGVVAAHQPTYAITNSAAATHLLFAKENKTGNEPYVGLLDDVRVYDHALTSNEVVTIMAGGGSSNVPPPVITTGSASSQPGMIQFSWQSVAGETYAVYKTTNLLANWPTQPVTNNISGDGTIKLFSEAVGALRAAYYRLKAVGN